MHHVGLGLLLVSSIGLLVCTAKGTPRGAVNAATGGRQEPIEIDCLTNPEYPEIPDVHAALDAPLARAGIRQRLEALPVRPRRGEDTHATYQEP